MVLKLIWAFPLDKKSSGRAVVAIFFGEANKFLGVKRAHKIAFLHLNLYSLHKKVFSRHH